jgi:hypothetical protein
MSMRALYAASIGFQVSHKTNQHRGRRRSPSFTWNGQATVGALMDEAAIPAIARQCEHHYEERAKRPNGKLNSRDDDRKRKIKVEGG